MTAGIFSLPIVGDAPADDPWKRGYLRPPPLGEQLEVSFPLQDVRDDVFGTEGGAKFLSAHGFTAVNHPTRMKSRDDYEDIDMLEDVYFPEVRDIIKNATGASEVFITNALLRRTPETNDDMVVKPTTQITPGKNPNGLTTRSGAVVTPFYLKAPPTRMPHLDYTPLSARQVTRHWRTDINAAASERGIIAAEDDICQRGYGGAAIDDRSDHAISEQYNKTNGKRYAAFSVWRPLVPVSRDPIAMLPRRDLDKQSSDTSPLVLSRYVIKVPGDPKLGGDFLRELACVKVKTTDRPKIQQVAEQLKWRYVSNQTPDEALVIKFFDSAALGPDAIEAQAPIHASPDLGEEASGPPRESIEVRLMAFW